MGTRNLTMVYSKGIPKIAQYCQWDGYLSGVGMNVLGQLRRMNIESFREKVDRLGDVERSETMGGDTSSMLIENELTELVKKMESNEIKLKMEAPHFSRDCGPDILRLVNEDIVDTVMLSVDFAADSLFCEWAYVIDLDKRTFEIYKGFNQDPLTPDDRFYSLQEKMSPEDEYYPVKIIGFYSLDNLPDDATFLKTGQDYNIPFEKLG